MKTKILIGVLFCSLMVCANKAPKSNVTSKSAPAGEAVYFVEDTVVDQSAGLQIIEALSKVYGNDPNVVGGFIGSSRCPSFLEGVFFDGSTLVFQVRGDTAHARRILESAAGSKAFRLEQVTESNYSQQQLISIVDELNQRYDTLTDKKLKSNMCGWGAGLRNVEVRFILNTPEARQAFREKLMDSPAIRFEGPEQPIIDERIGITDTLGISLHPEYSAYSTDSSTASFVLLNQGNKNIMCGAHYSITYEDENGIWRALPTNGAAIDIGYVVFPGGHKLFTARLYPEVHPNKAGRYRFFYEVTLDFDTPLHRDILMMTEFHLTDNKKVVERAIKMNIPKEPEGYGIRYVPVQEEPVEENTVYEVVDNMPEFPGGMIALMDFIDNNIQYPVETQKKGMQGRVVVQFIVDEDGCIIEPNIVRSVEPFLDEEALRIIKMLPKWKPGTLYGKPVKVKFTVPVRFTLPTD
ncbi:energy transducer TonB [Bacteroides salyersiae]|uniref:energy transducer TonB n=1 Tax=Bacteroides salyersiae TaxID=291644 RepID=UPI001C38EC0D|nr:energy transducer TonB [Bacteroides salyersiae]MBV4205456.1 energy transducer TonB [Bacteroides salyersiae]MCB6651234.1 energy transducer TonB [Bacteroides salyersiae]